ncbi:MAG TPA: extracellular solute-binding protein, partial [Nitrospiraceae bacterium]|nr:extracellular solute-binding protein [Nitrospiraceae bacterium]
MSILRLLSHGLTISILSILLAVNVLSFSVIDSLAADRLVVYSGRAERLIKPVLDAFQTKSGVHIDLLSSGSTELVNRLQAEGARTSADVFITNEVGALERARELKLLAPIDTALIDGKIPAEFRASDNSWIGLSGRVWLVIYNTSLVKPADIQSVLDL